MEATGRLRAFPRTGLLGLSLYFHCDQLDNQEAWIVSSNLWTEFNVVSSVRNTAYREPRRWPVLLSLGNNLLRESEPGHSRNRGAVSGPSPGRKWLHEKCKRKWDTTHLKTGHPLNSLNPKISAPGRLYEDDHPRAFIPRRTPRGTITGLSLSQGQYHKAHVRIPNP